jgi:hypothetical protein
LLSLREQIVVFKALLFSILLFILKSTLTKSQPERIASLIGLILVTVVAVIFEGSQQVMLMVLPIVLGLNTVGFLYFHRLSDSSKVLPREKQ